MRLPASGAFGHANGTRDNTGLPCHVPPPRPPYPHHPHLHTLACVGRSGPRHQAKHANDAIHGGHADAKDWHRPHAAEVGRALDDLPHTFVGCEVWQALGMPTPKTWACTACGKIRTPVRTNNGWCTCVGCGGWQRAEGILQGAPHSGAATQHCTCPLPRPLSIHSLLKPSLVYTLAHPHPHAARIDMHKPIEDTGKVVLLEGGARHQHGAASTPYTPPYCIHTRALPPTPAKSAG
eukprot:351721-Chlamydomonas_euryale.AAC.2